MSNRLNTRPKLIGNVKGLTNTSILVGALVHQKPLLSFLLPAQVFVNDENEIVPGATINDGLSPAVIGVEFHAQIDPTKLTPTLNNRMSACGARLSSAQGMMAAVLRAQQDPNAPVRKITREDLPDSALLVSVLEEQDAAADDRLLAMVAKNGDGETMWDYVDKDGNTPNLTAEFLKANPQVADALQTMLAEWLGFSRASLAEATTTRAERGTREWTSETVAPSSSASPGNSSVLAPVANQEA